MSEDRLGLLIVAIVAVVAVVSLFLLNSDGTMFVSDDVDESSALTGQGAGGRFSDLIKKDNKYTKKTTTTSSSKSCTESDGGFAPMISGVTKGLLSGTYTTKKDVCIDEDTLREYVCRGKSISTRSVECSSLSMCIEGACSVIGRYSDFDDDGDGWTIIGDPDASRDESGVITPDYHTDGSIYMADQATGGVMYWVAPEEYLDDKSSLLGRYLNYKLKLSNIDGYVFPAIDVMLVSSEGTTLVYFSEDNYYEGYPGINWVSYSIKLDEDGGWKDATGTTLSTSSSLLTQYSDDLTLATNNEIEEVLGTLAALYIRAEFIHGGETVHADDFYFGIRS